MWSVPLGGGAEQSVTVSPSRIRGLAQGQAPCWGRAEGAAAAVTTPKPSICHTFIFSIPGFIGFWLGSPLKYPIAHTGEKSQKSVTIIISAPGLGGFQVWVGVYHASTRCQKALFVASMFAPQTKCLVSILLSHIYQSAMCTFSTGTRMGLSKI